MIGTSVKHCYMELNMSGVGDALGRLWQAQLLGNLRGDRGGGQVDRALEGLT
jgi:hypothetical protein